MPAPASASVPTSTPGSTRLRRAARSRERAAAVREVTMRRRASTSPAGIACSPEPSSRASRPGARVAPGDGTLPRVTAARPSSVVATGRVAAGGRARSRRGVRRGRARPARRRGSFPLEGRALLAEDGFALGELRCRARELGPLGGQLLLLGGELRASRVRRGRPGPGACEQGGQLCASAGDLATELASLCCHALRRGSGRGGRELGGRSRARGARRRRGSDRRRGRCARQRRGAARDGAARGERSYPTSRSPAHGRPTDVRGTAAASMRSVSASILTLR